MPIGQDATVSYGDLDFQFINNFKNPVYIYTKYEPGAVTCWIIGAREDKPEESRVLLEYSGAIGFNTQEKVAHAHVSYTPLTLPPICSVSD